MTTAEKLDYLCRMVQAESENVRREYPDTRGIAELCRRHNARAESAIYQEARIRVFRALEGAE